MRGKTGVRIVAFRECLNSAAYRESSVQTKVCVLGVAILEKVRGSNRNRRVNMLVLKSVPRMCIETIGWEIDCTAFETHSRTRLRDTRGECSVTLNVQQHEQPLR